MLPNCLPDSLCSSTFLIHPWVLLRGMSSINPGYLICSQAPDTSVICSHFCPCETLSGMALGIHCGTSQIRSLPSWSLRASGELADPITQAVLICAKCAAHRVTLCQSRGPREEDGGQSQPLPVPSSRRREKRAVTRWGTPHRPNPLPRVTVVIKTHQT